MSSHLEHVLHLAGHDGLDPAFDPQVAPGYDPSLAIEGPAERNREHMPQLGPDFVRFVVEQFSAQNELMRRQLAKWSEKPQTFISVSSMRTDGSGNISRALSDKAIFLDPPPGWTFALHRIVCLAPGSAFNFGAPFNGAAAYWEIRENDEAIDGASLVAAAANGTAIPFVRTWGTRDAPHIRDGQLASFFLSAGPANTNITLKTQMSAVREIEG